MQGRNKKPSRHRKAVHLCSCTDKSFCREWMSKVWYIYSYILSLLLHKWNTDFKNFSYSTPKENYVWSFWAYIFFIVQTNKFFFHQGTWRNNNLQIYYEKFWKILCKVIYCIWERVPLTYMCCCAYAEIHESCWLFDLDNFEIFSKCSSSITFVDIEMQKSSKT